MHQIRSLCPPVLSAVALTLLLALAGCSREKSEDEGPGPEELYESARKSLLSKNYEGAIATYRTLTVRYPFGRHAEQALLDMAYAQHKARQPEAAGASLDRFLRTYPTHPNVDYAWYLKGLVHYDQTMGLMRTLFPEQVKDRDQQSAHESFRNFQELIRRHPDSRYVPDARQRMVFLRNVMAEYELTVGEYYLRRGANIAAVNRARFIIENYPGAPATVDALDLMIRAYERLEMPQLAADTRRVLEYNYADLTDEEKRESLLRRLWPFD